MLTFLVVLYFMNICLAQTQNEIRYNPNNFHLFENFELSKELCHMETELLPKIQWIHNLLNQRKTMIGNFLNKVYFI